MPPNVPRRPGNRGVQSQNQESSQFNCAISRVFGPDSDDDEPHGVFFSSPASSIRTGSRCFNGGIAVLPADGADFSSTAPAMWFEIVDGGIVVTDSENESVRMKFSLNGREIVDKTCGESIKVSTTGPGQQRVEIGPAGCVNPLILEFDHDTGCVSLERRPARISPINPDFVYKVHGFAVMNAGAVIVVRVDH